MDPGAPLRKKRGRPFKNPEAAAAKARAAADLSEAVQRLSADSSAADVASILQQQQRRKGPMPLAVRLALSREPGEIVVINPGSAALRIGFADWPAPKERPMAAAVRLRAAPTLAQSWRGAHTPPTAAALGAPDADSRPVVSPAMAAAFAAAAQTMLAAAAAAPMTSPAAQAMTDDAAGGVPAGAAAEPAAPAFPALPGAEDARFWLPRGGAFPSARGAPDADLAPAAGAALAADPDVGRWLRARLSARERTAALLEARTERQRAAFLEANPHIEQELQQEQEMQLQQHSGNAEDNSNAVAADSASATSSFSAVAAVAVSELSTAAEAEAALGWAFTDVSAAPAVVTGAAALRIAPHEPYALRLPLRRGRLRDAPPTWAMDALLQRRQEQDIDAENGDGEGEDGWSGPLGAGASMDGASSLALVTRIIDDALQQDLGLSLPPRPLAAPTLTEVAERARAAAGGNAGRGAGARGRGRKRGAAAGTAEAEAEDGDDNDNDGDNDGEDGDGDGDDDDDADADAEAEAKTNSTAAGAGAEAVKTEGSSASAEASASAGSKDSASSASASASASAAAATAAAAASPLSRYAAALVVPDDMPVAHVSRLLDHLLLRLGFRAAWVHRESAMACLAAGINTACVVDVGAHATRVACFHDGAPVPRTALTLAYGGADVTAALLWGLQRTGDADDSADSAASSSSSSSALVPSAGSSASASAQQKGSRAAWVPRPSWLTADWLQANALKERHCRFPSPALFAAARARASAVMLPWAQCPARWCQQEPPAAGPAAGEPFALVAPLPRLAAAAALAPLVLFHPELAHPARALAFPPAPPAVAGLDPALALLPATLAAQCAAPAFTYTAADAGADAMAALSVLGLPPGAQPASLLPTRGRPKKSVQLMLQQQREQRAAAAAAAAAAAEGGIEVELQPSATEDTVTVLDVARDADGGVQVSPRIAPANCELTPAAAVAELALPPPDAALPEPGSVWETEEQAQRSAAAASAAALGVFPFVDATPPPAAACLTAGLPWGVARPENNNENGAVSADSSKNNTTMHFELSPASPVFALAAKTMPLDKAITASILAVPAPELRRRLATQVLLIGGGARVPGFSDEVEERLVNYITGKDVRIEIVNVLCNVKDIDPAHLSWRGATVVCWAEGVRDQWLTRDEWAVSGVKMLRERVAFNWTDDWM